jgi:hypothetical protein
MAKNLSLLAKRRSELDDQAALSVKNSQREATFIINNNNNFINNIKGPKSAQTDKTSHVLIYRKIASLRNKTSLNNNLLDKRQQQLLKNNLTSFAYFKNALPIVSKADQQQQKGEIVSETEKGENESIQVPPMIIKAHPSNNTPHQSETKELKSANSKHDCLFCKYERVISSDKLPNFARKRINEIFEHLTNPEKYEKRRAEMKKSGKNLNKSTRSNGSTYGSSSYLTTSQILDY